MAEEIKHEKFREFIGDFGIYEITLSLWKDKKKTVDILREIKLIAPDDGVVRNFIEDEAKDLGGTWEWKDDVYEQENGLKYFIYERIPGTLSRTVLV